MKEGKKEAHSQFGLSFFLFLKAADSISLSLLSLLPQAPRRTHDGLHSLFTVYSLSLSHFAVLCSDDFSMGAFFLSLFPPPADAFQHANKEAAKTLARSVSQGFERTCKWVFGRTFEIARLEIAFPPASFSRHITHHNVRKLSSFSRFNRDPFTVGSP